MLKITTLKVANALTTHMKEYSFYDYKSLWWELSKQSGPYCSTTQRLLNRWTSQLDLGCTTGGLERVVSVHNST